MHDSVYLQQILSSRLKKSVSNESIYDMCAMLIIDTKIILSMYGDLIPLDTDYIENYFKNLDIIDELLNKDTIPQKFKL